MKVDGERTFTVRREVVWNVLNDPAQMAELMPGVQSFEIHDPTHWSAKVKIPLGLGGLAMTIDFEKTEEREGEFSSLHAKGNGVGAMMNMQTSFTLEEIDEGTKMLWAAEVSIAGPVGAMGQRVLQPIVKQQVSQVLAALDKQVTAASEAGSETAAAPQQ
jgi:carbon monoxide dehydrogenase subunit G